MSKAVILKTNNGVLLLGNWQCSNGAYWDAEGCFKYCNGERIESLNRHQAYKLADQATTLGFRPKTGKDWYKHRENFIDIEIPYDEVDQTWKEDYIETDVFIE